MAEIQAPPPGFEIDQSSIPPPPPGFSREVITDSSGKVIGSGQSQPTGGPVQMDVYTAPQNRIANAVESVTGSSMAGNAAGTVVKSALPMAGSIVGLYMAGIPGEAIGGALGEIGNQGLGITEPSVAEIGLAMAAGPVARGVIGAGKHLLGAALKAGGGRQVIAEVAEGLTAKLFNPIQSSDDLLAAAARKANVTIPTIRTAQAITNTLRTEGGRANTPVKQSIKQALEPLEEFYQAMPGVGSATNASEMAVEAKRLRLMSSQAFKDGNPDLSHALSNVRNAMFDDAAKSGVPDLRAIATTQR
jgi:hypothetical protein